MHRNCHIGETANNDWFKNLLEKAVSFLFLIGTLLATLCLSGTPMHGGRKPTAAEPSGMQL